MSETMVRLHLNIFLCTVAAYRNKGGMLFYHLQLSMVAGEGEQCFPICTVVAGGVPATGDSTILYFYVHYCTYDPALVLKSFHPTEHATIFCFHYLLALF